MRTQPRSTCPIYLHPAVLKDPDAINKIVADTGLAIVVGGNRAALSLIKHPARKHNSKLPEANGFCQALCAIADRALSATTPNQAEDHGPWDGGHAA